MVHIILQPEYDMDTCVGDISNFKNLNLMVSGVLLLSFRAPGQKLDPWYDRIFDQGNKDARIEAAGLPVVALRGKGTPPPPKTPSEM